MNNTIPIVQVQILESIDEPFIDTEGKCRATVQPRSCVVIGSTTLAIFCAEQIRAAGHIIQFIIAADEVFQTWAIQENIPSLHSIDALEAELAKQPVDWLFSVDNPIILPASLIGWVREGTFNYHDSPLPRYAGRHATSWALLAGETEHAVSWHIMTTDVDAGHIAIQQSIFIEPDETVLSLNLKCYQAARESFMELLVRLIQGNLVLQPQDVSARSFYSSARRPEGGAYLDWTQHADALSALVRALDFGELYSNPLTCPKIWLELDTVQVNQLQKLDQRSGAAPGTLISIESNGWQIATGSEDVWVNGLATLEGPLVDPEELAHKVGLQPGKQLPNLGADQTARIKEVLEMIAPHETFWRNRLRAYESIQLPYETVPRQALMQWTTSAWHNVPSYGTNDLQRTVLAAFAIYLARLTGQTQLQIGYHFSKRQDAITFSSTFASTVPMEFDIEANASFSNVLEQIEEELKRLAQRNTFARDLVSRDPLLRKIPELRTAKPWSIGISMVDDSEHEQVIGAVLTLQIDVHGRFRWLYDKQGLDTKVIDRMSAHLREIIQAAQSNDQTPVTRLNLLSETERELLLKTWNATQVPYPDKTCLHRLFEEQVERTSNAIALVCEDQKFSYADLNAQANRLAHRLIELGVRPDTCVALCVVRSLKMIVGLLAILKAGGAYLPLNMEYPSERLVDMVADSKPMVLLSIGAPPAAVEQCLGTNIPVLDLQADAAQWKNHSSSNLDPLKFALNTGHLAYVIYTSGSTGRPKGVMVEHRSVVNLVNAIAEKLNIGPQDRMLQFASLSFDASLEEIFVALTRGAMLVLRTDAWLTGAEQFWSLCEANQITTMDVPVQFWTQLAQAQLPVAPNVRAIIIGGDALSAAARRTWFAGPGHRPRLFNLYGPTETTISSTVYEVTADDNRWRTIGRPLANTCLYVLDASMQPVPIGVVGELYIGGDGVARGYLNRPELTTERFLRDPFSEDEDARIYKTGDLVRYLPDGNLEFMGRNDHQVKLRGFRIELGEIEACLTDHPQVREAVVLALGEGSEKRLVAYVVAEADEQLAATLRARLAANLPEYMVPAAFVCLEALPVTLNGKLDRRALPAPSEIAFARQAYEAPQGEVETVLASIWVELLKVERISRHDSFFALGGHSLLAVQMIERLRRLGLTISVRALFDAPTLSKLAQSLGRYHEVAIPPNLITTDTTVLTPAMLPLIDLSQSDIDRIVEQTPGGVANIQDIYALSPLQEGMLFHHLLAKEGDPYLLIEQITFAKRELLDRYLDAAQQVANRHDILRTAFIWEGLSTTAQVVWRRASLSITELTLNSAEGPIAEQLLQRFDPRHYRISLTQAPLLHFIVAQDSDGRWQLFQLFHHLIIDHSALEVLQLEIQAFVEGRGETLPNPQPFRNLIAQARLGVSQEAHKRFFTEMLTEVDEPTLPFGLAEVHRDGAQVSESRLMLPQELNDRLRAQAKRLNVSLASLCHLAWAQVIARASGQQRVVFGTVLFGRMQGGEGADSALGLFINTLPLRFDLDQRGVQECVRDTQARLAALLEHEHASLALAQRCSGVPAGTPLFSSLLNYRHNGVQDKEVNQDKLDTKLPRLEERDNYPVGLSIEDFGQALGLIAQIVQPFDPDRICGYMQQALQSLVEALEFAPDMPVCQLGALPPSERKLLLDTWNATAAPYPDQRCLHQLFEAQAERTPGAIALMRDQQTVSYEEVNAQANRLAHYLRDLGVQPDSRVALYAQPGMEVIIGMLAVLKAGGAYMPLDPNYPTERLIDMASDSAPVVLLSIGAPHEAVAQCLGTNVPVLDLQADAAQWKNHSSSNLDPLKFALNTGHLAYVIYTSGSTGRPKGVMVEHRSVVNLVNAIAEKLNIGPQDRMLQFASLSFDASLEEIFVALTRGAMLVLRTDAWLTGAEQFWSLCEANQITTMDVPVQFWTQLAQAQLPVAPNVRAIIIGGDALSAAARRTWFAGPGHRPRLFNLYGPTETTISSTVYEVTADDNRWRTIGRPLANTCLYVLDASMQPVPIGVVGELYIGGDGVARGYLNRPELTTERFLRDPFSEDEDARIYKTGDLVRYLPDGNLEFMGRNDHQVKLRGFRIELGEIEARLTDHPQVREAVVLALGEGGEKRLVAYVVAEADEQLAATLRACLAANLPEYMVPAAFVCLEALPLTSNGKLNRRALPIPDKKAFARQTYEAPQGKIETALATIWTELLKVERVSRHDSFFALGGHSLLAVQMIERLRRLGLTMSVRVLFDMPTLSRLAQSLYQHDEVIIPPNLITADAIALMPEMLPLIDISQADIDRIIEKTPGGVSNIQDIYALSSLQDGMLFHHLLAKEGDPYLLMEQMAFANRELLDRYLDAVQQVVNRHDILRTAFIWEGLSTSAQVVWRHAPLLIEELSLDLSAGPIIEQLQHLFNPRQQRIDLTQAPLLRLAIAQDNDGRWLLVQLMHHLIADHVTADLMAAEVQAFIEGQSNTLPPARPYRNLVAHVYLGMKQEEHERFFAEMLAEVEEPTFPFGLVEVYRDGDQVTESYRLLPQELNDRLRAQAKKLGISLASLCHLAWARVLACTSGQTQVVFGTVLLGRMQAGAGEDHAMGLFLNMLPLRIDLQGRNVQDSARQTHASLAALLEHEYASLALAQRCSGVSTGTPLFSSLLNYRHNMALPDEGQTIPGMELIDVQERSNYPFVLSVEDFGSALGLTAQVVQPIDPACVCNYMQQVLQNLVQALEHMPDLLVEQLGVLPNKERECLLQTWNMTTAPYSEHLCIHQVFEAQVERTPNAAALVYEDQVLSYAELNRRANQLAYQLIKLGVEPETRIAICVKRSPAMVVGLLAILKAGGAYVPLDPEYPRERSAHILADAAPTILLADRVGCIALGKEAMASLMVLDPNENLTLSIANPQVSELTSHHLAYVIYTSGSTGIPKGVMVEHQSLVNLAQAQVARFGVQPSSRVLQFASLSFDASVSEIFMALSCGASLYLPPETARSYQNALWDYLAEYEVTHVTLPPALLQNGKNLPNLNNPLTLILAGEALSARLLQDLRHYGTVFNAYGPTETTVCATIWRDLGYFSNAVVPIGRPLENTQLYLLDHYGQPVPLGAVGELYIGGVGVARGYLNHPELTGERFLPDSFSEHEDARMYKTGDLARYLPDGNLEFVGRNDHQVKIRGFRIEPGEIEARLIEHPQVLEAAVIARGEGNDKHLIAYVVAEADEQLARTLRVHLAARLPEYMVPAAFVGLDELPLTLNGKLERRALPAPDGEAFVRQAYEAPQGEIETALASIWTELIGVERISRYDNFFELGGHSLLVVRMISLIRATLNIEITIRTLFDAPTVAKLARHLLKRSSLEDDSFDILLPIKPQGTRSPLFCVHPVAGLSWGYSALAQHLDLDQPVYGLQSRGLNGTLPLAETIEMMAADYIRQMRRVQSEGPYYLLGWSFGGKVAHHMATQLEQQGEKVALLVMLDSYPSHLSSEDDTLQTLQTYYTEFLAHHSDEEMPETGEYWWNKIWHILQNNYHLSKSFSPLIYCGNMLFFRAMLEQDELISPSSPDVWRPYVLGDIEVYDIQCKHDDMDQPVPAAAIGRILAQKLNELQEQRFNC